MDPKAQDDIDESQIPLSSKQLNEGVIGSRERPAKGAGFQSQNRRAKDFTSGGIGRAGRSQSLCSRGQFRARENASGDSSWLRAPTSQTHLSFEHGSGRQMHSLGNLRPRHSLPLRRPQGRKQLSPQSCVSAPLFEPRAQDFV